jgi:hypothetical protein
MLRILVAHGPAYLTDDELATQMDRHMAILTASLKEPVHRARQDVLGLPQEAAARQSVGFSRVRLIKAAIAGACVAALHPQDVLIKLLKTREHAQHG